MSRCETDLICEHIGPNAVDSKAEFWVYTKQNTNRCVQNDEQPDDNDSDDHSSIAH